MSDSNATIAQLMQPPWIRAVKELGFPIALVLILITGFGVIGKWLMDRDDASAQRQQTLMESTIKTNQALTDANDRNSQAMGRLIAALEVANSQMLSGIMGNQALLKDNGRIHESMDKVHQGQCEQIQQTVGLMEKAHELMKDVPQQRVEQTSVLKEILAAVKEKKL
jgi:hypothetical protein